MTMDAGFFRCERYGGVTKTACSDFCYCAAPTSRPTTDNKDRLASTPFNLEDYNAFKRAAAAVSPGADREYLNEPLTRHNLVRDVSVILQRFHSGEWSSSQATDAVIAMIESVRL